MQLLRRIAVVLLGYLVATLAASLVVTASAYLIAISHPRMAMPMLSGVGMHLKIIPYVFVPIVAAAFIPSMIAAAVAEIFRLRSILFYGVIGCAVAAVSLIGLRLLLSLIMFRPKPPAHGFAMSFSIPWSILAAGVVASLVYWAIAGRNAGTWRTISSGS